MSSLSKEGTVGKVGGHIYDGHKESGVFLVLGDHGSGGIDGGASDINICALRSRAWRCARVCSLHVCSWAAGDEWRGGGQTQRAVEWVAEAMGGR